MKPQPNDILRCCSRLLCALVVVAMLIAHTGCSGRRTQKGVDTQGDAPTAGTPDTTSGTVEDTAHTNVIGHYMDGQARELSKIKSAKTKRVGDEVKVTWNSAILFDLDSAMLRLEAQEDLLKMVTILDSYPDTDILITGHADSVGVEAYDLKLSERRAQSVETFFLNAGIPSPRIRTLSEVGRLLNQSVEIEISPNDALRARADQLQK